MRKAKKKCYGILAEKQVTDNKSFLKTAKPFLSDKTVNSPKTMLVEKYEIINNDAKIAEIFNTFFTNIVSNLKILPYQDTDFMEGIDPVIGNDSITFILPKYKKPSKHYSKKKICH